MSNRERSWRLPYGLIALSAIPLTASRLRLSQLVGGPASHSPLVAHVVGAMTYASSGSCSPCQGSAAAGGTRAGTGVLADLAKGAGWAINLAIAESAIRRPAAPPPRTPQSPQQAGALS